MDDDGIHVRMIAIRGRRGRIREPIEPGPTTSSNTNTTCSTISEIDQQPARLESPLDGGHSLDRAEDSVVRLLKVSQRLFLLGISQPIFRGEYRRARCI